MIGRSTGGASGDLQDPDVLVQLVFESGPSGRGTRGAGAAGVAIAFGAGLRRDLCGLRSLDTAEEISGALVTVCWGCLSNLIQGLSKLRKAQ